MSIALALGLASAAAPAAEPRPQSLLVLDASGSMWGQIDGRPKITIAREAIDRMLAEWSGGDLGLMAYGHRRKGDCNDIELLQPVGAFDASTIRRRAGALNPRGMTPISAAVRQAAELLRFSEQKATVILVSDGEETCDADPCALGRELEAAGVDFTAHVIGFDLREGPARAQLQCLAESTGGRYFEAEDAAGLDAALEEVAAAEPPPPPAAPEAAPGHPNVKAREGEQWIEGYALWPYTDITLTPGEAPGLENLDFTVDQTAEDCQRICLENTQCAGWHYEPTGSYFVSYPRCHLKGHHFAVTLKHEGEGWVAGIREGVALIFVEDEEAVE
ncbi:hypothetical protein P873_10955 [Arenimonas composti TR7-09 = DSM 18010]|uniref:VWFA domain-containing protein n=2 Tax=Arenimonas TaxID=490567 RepID=A0A091BFC1_9GAMM|nr:hypothetical protein P873_10955 [Arenimonas composti TR7-09 = DSM 18010]